MIGTVRGVPNTLGYSKCPFLIRHFGAIPFRVTKTADTNDGICDPNCSVREATSAANTNPGIGGVRR
jgi:CSLREA domain-containing protein